MTKIKSQGDGLLPAVSRRQFIQVGSALAALPFVARVGKAEASEGTAAQDEPAENIIQTCSTFDCGGKCDIRAHVNDGVCPDFHRARLMSCYRKSR